ncbi:hypothetical protein ABZY90_38725, partial [Streptomyces sp. NPDC006422]
PPRRPALGRLPARAQAAQHRVERARPAGTRLDVGAGAALLLALGLVAADAALAAAGLPGAAVFAGAAGLLAAGALVVGLRACGREESVKDWRAAVRAAARDAALDLPGSALVLLAVATCALCAWMLLPLAFLVPGPLALALVAVAGRAQGPVRLSAGRLPVALPAGGATHPEGS